MSELASSPVKTGLVSFVGAGPGAADLITLRGARRIAAADVVVWAPSVVDAECVREHARADAELVDCSRVSGEEIVELYRRAARDRLRVVRLCSGDPVLWGAVREQVESCRRIGVDAEVVPGVSPVSAAASAVGRELTDTDQSLILTRVDATALPNATQIRQFAAHGATLGVFVAAARTGQLVEELAEGGYGEDTPVVVSYKATWPDELLINTTLGELESVVKQRKLWRHTLFLVGRAMSSNGKPRYRRLEAAEPIAEAESVDVPTARTPKRSAWSARAGRTSRIAAARAEQDGEGQPASQAAWRAVHGWQASARSAPRSSSTTTRTRKLDVDQQPLDIESAPVEKAVEPARPVVSAAAIATPVRASATVPEPVETEPTETKPAPTETKPAPRAAAARKKPAAKQSGAKQPAKPRATQARGTRKNG
ncbi:cobalt-precorrin-4/precorrin-4 C(11)-methyltransferase [Kutzneria albida]|uniref:Tetrapyrrole methylase domain-containing protein n=1 Tax=Kutzneria albida DSM 43870 TaxID=1449976 RepID=W5WIZ9_9PSEU|nr:cobalt-precorrin-4/precorrin-4 C(11)-methyltransferase [Kutzneria albida]AHI00592.1 hypothetical protein KALB_7234 [Kutzneria albida DSM 43870]